MYPAVNAALSTCSIATVLVPCSFSLETSASTRCLPQPRSSITSHPTHCQMLQGSEHPIPVGILFSLVPQNTEVLLVLLSKREEVTLFAYTLNILWCNEIKCSSQKQTSLWYLWYLTGSQWLWWALAGYCYGNHLSGRESSGWWQLYPQNHPGFPTALH